MNEIGIDRILKPHVENVYVIDGEERDTTKIVIITEYGSINTYVLTDEQLQALKELININEKEKESKNNG